MIHLSRWLYHIVSYIFRVSYTHNRFESYHGPARPAWQSASATFPPSLWTRCSRAAVSPPAPAANASDRCDPRQRPATWQWPGWDSSGFRHRDATRRAGRAVGVASLQVMPICEENGAGIYKPTWLGDFVWVNVGVHIPAPWSIWDGESIS